MAERQIFDDDDWIVCRAAPRPVRDDRVECPVAGFPVAVTACLACHQAPGGGGHVKLIGQLQGRGLASGFHPSVPGFPKLGDKEVRSVRSYIEAYLSENPK